MKMIYTNENRLIVGNAKNILESYDIDVILKNEFASSAIGEVSAFDAWVEIWLTNEADYERAIIILESSLSQVDAAEWLCSQCKEQNDASFEFCWNCQGESF
ncbi:MAG: hypothetical protein ACJAYG_000865 [Oceanicoccus sp.]|jgi:hypothetical protein